MIYIKILGDSYSPVIDELRKLIPVYPENYPVDSDDTVSAYLIDYSIQGNRGLALPSDGLPVILLNTNMTDSIQGCLATIPSKCSILHFYDNYTIWQVLDIPMVTRTERQSNFVKQNEDTSCSFLGDSKKSCERPMRPLCDEELAVLIETNIDIAERTALSMEVEDSRKNYLDDLPIDLPEKQYNFQYVRLEVSKKLDEVDQTVYNAQLIELALIASFNPLCKYLRVRLIGAGFNPGYLYYDDNYDRGFFQSKITTYIEPHDSRIVTYDTSPKTVSGVTTYTTGSSFNVGVDISKNPTFKTSYTISNSETISIQDFDMFNKSMGIKSEWETGITIMRDNIWNMFSQAAFRRAKVKPLPELAKHNAQPHCEAVYRAEGMFPDKVNMSMGWQVMYHHLWVSGSAVAFPMHYSYQAIECKIWESDPWILDFNLVSA